VKEDANTRWKKPRENSNGGEQTTATGAGPKIPDTDLLLTKKVPFNEPKTNERRACSKTPPNVARTERGGAGGQANERKGEHKGAKGSNKGAQRVETYRLKRRAALVECRGVKAKFSQIPIQKAPRGIRGP